jgi:hypothetical protein
VVFVSAAAVGAVGVPVSAGDAVDALALNVVQSVLDSRPFTDEVAVGIAFDAAAVKRPWASTVKLGTLVELP